MFIRERTDRAGIPHEIANTTIVKPDIYHVQEVSWSYISFKSIQYLRHSVLASRPYRAAFSVHTDNIFKTNFRVICIGSCAVLDV